MENDWELFTVRVSRNKDIKVTFIRLGTIWMDLRRCHSPPSPRPLLSWVTRPGAWPASAASPRARPPCPAPRGLSWTPCWTWHRTAWLCLSRETWASAAPPASPGTWAAASAHAPRGLTLHCDDLRSGLNILLGMQLNDLVQLYSAQNT